MKYEIAFPEIDVQGNSLSITDGDTSPDAADDTDFGRVDIINDTISHTYTIENADDANLTLSGSRFVDIAGNHASDFTVAAQPTSPVAGSGNDHHMIKFDPSTDGCLFGESLWANAIVHCRLSSNHFLSLSFL